MALLAAAALLGCAPPARAHPDSPVGYQAPRDLVLGRKELARIVDGLPASSPQRPLLADGRVSQEELALSWSRLRSCLEAQGFSISGPVTNPITNTDYLYTYSRTPEADASAAPRKPTDEEVAAECENTYWNPVAQVYSANTPQRLSDGLARFMADCMRRAHYPRARAGSTFDDFVRDDTGRVTPARLRQANTCLDQGVPQLFPDLPYYPRP